jgi:hypothetical protein
MFTNSVLTLKKIQHVSITKINRFMQLTEIIVVYSDNYTKHINTLCGENAELLNENVGGTCKLPLCFEELICRSTL